MFKLSLFMMVLVAIVHGSSIDSVNDSELVKRNRPRIVTSLTTNHGARETVVTSRGGQAITLAAHGSTTVFGGKTYTVKPTPRVHTNVKLVHGAKVTVVTSHGGPAITLAAHGKVTSWGGSTYTVPTATPTPHNHKNLHKNVHSSVKSAHGAKVTVVTQKGGGAITLAKNGVKTVFAGKTYTVARPKPTHRVHKQVGHHHKHKHGHWHKHGHKKHGHNWKHKHGHKKHHHGHKKHGHGHKHWKHKHAHKKHGHKHNHQKHIHTDVRFINGRPATVLAHDGHSITLAKYGGTKTMFAGKYYMATAAPSPKHRNREYDEIEQREFDDIEMRQVDELEQREVDDIEMRETQPHHKQHKHKHAHKKHAHKHHAHKHAHKKHGHKHGHAHKQVVHDQQVVHDKTIVHHVYKADQPHGHQHKHAHKKHGHGHQFKALHPVTKTVTQHGSAVTMIQAPNKVVLELAPTGTVTVIAGATYTVKPQPVKNVKFTRLFFKKNSASSAATGGMLSVVLGAALGAFMLL